MKMWEVEDNIRVSFNGLYNKSFGNTIRNVLIKNKDILKLNEKIDSEYLEKLEHKKEITFLEIEEKIIAPLFNYKNGNDLHR
jgi:predicted alpha/beta-fold hydrolase